MKADQAEIIERLIAVGDLKGLSPEERSRYYIATCESLGLNPLTRPFEYITLNGKMVLYARKDATEQLRTLRQVSVEIRSREKIDDLYVVTSRAITPDGRTDESIGAVNIKGLSGENLANALMKAETKSKRRVTLSICGLGILDETEVETIREARIIEHEPRVTERPLQLAARPSEVASTSEAEACEQTGSEEPKPEHRDRVAEMRAHRARALVEAGCVERNPNSADFSVKSLGVQGDIYTIWKDDRGKVNCNCAELKEKRGSDKTFRCEHILAVKLFLDPDSQPQASAEQPPKNGAMATTFREYATLKQVRGIEAIFKAHGLDPQAECRKDNYCLIEELSREAAMKYLDHLQQRESWPAPQTEPEPEPKAETDRKALLDKARAMMEELAEMGHERFTDSKNRLIWIRNLAAQKWSIQVNPDSITKPGDLSDDLLAELVKELYAESERYTRHAEASQDQGSI